MSSTIEQLTEQKSELLEMVKTLQNKLSILINMTPTGDNRNTLTNENIKALTLIRKSE